MIVKSSGWLGSQSLHDHGLPRLCTTLKRQPGRFGHGDQVRRPDELLLISAKQAGVISRPQALATGVTPHQLRTLVDANAWQRPRRGVFVTHNGPLDDVSRVWAAVLRCGAGAVASHETAAHLVHLIKEPPPRAPPRGWRALLLEVCRDVKAGVESPLERRYLRFVERAHGLPVGARQRLERVGRATYRHDVLYEEFGVVVELDGLAYHRDHRAAADARRDNALMVEGLIVLRYRWADVASDPCGAARQIAAVLRRRGWTGEPGRCSNCRAGVDVAGGCGDGYDAHELGRANS